jgi:UDP-N-acetylmuramyl pentapeptide phosphotransferase/UDP-N-acetylglucosamine-1-phosphate transferase
LDIILLLESFIGSAIAFGFASILIIWLLIYIAVFSAVVISGFMRPEESVLLEHSGFLLAGMLLLLVGVVDDYIEIRPVAKIAAQTAAALVMILGSGVVLSDLGALGNNGEVLSTGVLAVPFTVFQPFSRESIGICCSDFVFRRRPGYRHVIHSLSSSCGISDL